MLLRSRHPNLEISILPGKIYHYLVARDDRCLTPHLLMKSQITNN